MSLFHQAGILFCTSRPTGWIIAPIIWISGIVHSESTIELKPAIMFAAALSFPLCLITFGVNDIYDVDSDVENARKRDRWIHGTTLAPCNHSLLLRAAVTSTVSIIALVLPASVSCPSVLAYTGSFLSLVWGYSMPPIRLKERPVLDSLSNGLICWLFWASGYIFSGEKALFLQIEPSAYNGRLVFLLAAALHSLAAVEDIEADSIARHRTIATSLGERFALVFSLACFTIATFVVEAWSLVRIATVAGVMTTTISLLLPYTRPLLTRLTYAGVYLGSITWILLGLIRIRIGIGQGGKW